jgi:hypothetical protein
MIKYLARRPCAKCQHSFIVMLVTHGPRLRTINGFCGNCDHSIKWQLVRGKASRPNFNVRKQTIVPIIFESDKKVEVPTHD